MGIPQVYAVREFLLYMCPVRGMRMTTMGQSWFNQGHLSVQGIARLCKLWPKHRRTLPRRLQWQCVGCKGHVELSS